MPTLSRIYIYGVCSCYLRIDLVSRFSQRDANAVFLFANAKNRNIMGTKNQTSETPVLRVEHLGQLFRAFYAEWEFNGARLKNLSCIMYDTYIAETEGLVEVCDASFFNMGLIEMLRIYSKNLTLIELGELFRENILNPLKNSDPYIVERMFYTCVANMEDLTVRGEIIHFFRSVEDLLNGVKILNGEKTI